MSSNKADSTWEISSKWEQSSITTEHVQNNTEIRNMLVGRGIKPEDLPVDEDIKKQDIFQINRNSFRQKKTRSKHFYNSERVLIRFFQAHYRHLHFLKIFIKYGLLVLWSVPPILQNFKIKTSTLVHPPYF